MKAIDPPQICPPFARYSHGMADERGEWLFTSGQLGVRPDGQFAEDTLGQAKQCFANLSAILEEAGMQKESILRLNAYVTDRAHMADYMAARDSWLAGITPPPASTLMIVTGFTHPEFKVEVELTAFRPRA